MQCNKWTQIKCAQCAASVTLYNTLIPHPPPPYSTVITKFLALKLVVLVGVHKSQWIAHFADNIFWKYCGFFSFTPSPFTECFVFIEKKARHFHKGKSAEWVTHCDLCTQARNYKFQCWRIHVNFTVLRGIKVKVLYNKAVVKHCTYFINVFLEYKCQKLSSA